MTDATVSQPQDPLRLWRGVTLPEWLDYNGHMTEHRYLQVFGESSDALYERLGVDFQRADDGAYYTLETHIIHRAEAKVGTRLWTETEILGFDEKRLHLFHRLHDDCGRLLATGEHLAIHVRDSSVSSASEQILARLGVLFDERRSLPAPAGTGSVLNKRLRFSR